MPLLLSPKAPDLQSGPALLTPALTHSSGGWTRTNGGLYLGNGLTVRPLLPTRVLQNNLAGPARLELAISDVTGRRSDQLNYGPIKNHVALGALGSYVDSARYTDRPCLCRNRRLFNCLAT